MLSSCSKQCLYHAIVVRNMFSILPPEWLALLTDLIHAKSYYRWPNGMLALKPISNMVNIDMPFIYIIHMLLLLCNITSLSVDIWDKHMEAKQWYRHENIYIYNDIGIDKLGHYQFKWWLVTCLVPSHCLNPFWLIVNWVLIARTLKSFTGY